MVIKHGTVDCFFVLCSFLFWGGGGWGSFRGQFGDHFRVGDHFGVGIISGAVQDSLSKLSLLLKDVLI